MESKIEDLNDKGRGRTAAIMEVNEKLEEAKSLIIKSKQ